MRILGIDPGYAIVGFGALDYVRGAFCPVQYGAITTQAHTLFEQRLEEIYFDMTQLLQNLKPDAVLRAYAESRGETLGEFALMVTRLEVYADKGTEESHQFVTLDSFGENIE